MPFTWWRRRRRRNILRAPFPAQWVEILQRNFLQYGWLSAEDRERLHQKTQVFVAEKYWEGCNGLSLTEEMKVTIAAQACLLVLAFEDEIFNRLLTVLIYPGDYLAKEMQHRGGVVIEGRSWRLGEAWHGGPVILSWPRVLEGGRVPDDGENVVFHEFAHVLDMRDGGVDGTPPLDSAGHYHTWAEVMSAEYERLVRHVERGHPTLLDPYGATSAAEFFAVATECFFEQPAELETRHAELYAVLKTYYRQDPATRVARMGN